MVLNIVKNDLPASCIAEYVRCVFDNAKVNIKDENAVSVDIEVTGKNELHCKYPLIPTLWMIFEDSTFAFRSGDKHRSRRIYGK